MQKLKQKRDVSPEQAIDDLVASIMASPEFNFNKTYSHLKKINDLVEAELTEEFEVEQLVAPKKGGGRK